MRRKRIWSFLVLLLVLPTVGAAGGGHSDSESTGAKSSSKNQPAQGTPIKVGAICACTGSFGTTIASAGKVAQAWEKSVNDAGGINGHPIELTLHDDGSNVGTSATLARELISDGVAVILDMTQLDAAWAQDASAAKIPVVGGNISGIPYVQNPFFYPSGQTNDSIVQADILTAKAAGAKRFAQMYCAEAPQCQESVGPHKTAGKQLKLPVVYNASISATAPNYTAQCVAAKQAKADAVFIGHSASVIAKVAQDCERQGYKPIYIEQGTGFTQQLSTTPGTKDRLWASFPILPFFASNAEPVKKMNKVLDKQYPGMRKDKNTWSTYATQAWTGGLLIERAVQLAAPDANTEVTAADMQKGLDSIKDETLGGWSPKLNFAAGQAHSVKCWYTARVQNGKPALVNGGKLTCSGGSS